MHRGGEKVIGTGGSARPLEPRWLLLAGTGCYWQIKPREDPSHAWHYAEDGYGDCNTYALTKRKALIAMGWPEDTLLLAAVYDELGEGHLVLVARTSEGDLVLDNRLPPVVAWDTLPYRWVAMQSQQSPARWVKVVDQRVMLATAWQHP